MTRLVYISERNDHFPFDAEQMLLSARRNNKKKFLTGVLFFSGRYFIQVLEGKRDSLSDTYHKISQDPRHKHVEIVSSRPIEQRLFCDWDMGFLGDTQSNQRNFLKFGLTDNLNPYELSETQILEFLGSRQFS